MLSDQTLNAGKIVMKFCDSLPPPVRLTTAMCAKEGGCRFVKRVALTVSGHADRQAFFEPAVLTSVPVQPDHQAFAVSQAPVLDLFLDAPPEEPLEKRKTETFKTVRNRSVV